MANRVLRVLVIEDNSDAAESLADFVRTYGHEVDVAIDGPRAFAKAKEKRPDLVLCDIGLPWLDGYQVARLFRSDPALHDVRLVAVTAYADPDDVRRAMAAGFVGHIAKPPDTAELEKYLLAP